MVLDLVVVVVLDLCSCNCRFGSNLVFSSSNFVFVPLNCLLLLISILIIVQVLKTSDEVKVKAQLLRMVHSLFHQVLLQIVLDVK